MAILGKEKYNQEKIDKLADYVRLYAEKGQPVDYEVIVDGFKAVRRTSDPEMFSTFENFVSGSTQSVEVLFYTGMSNNNDKYIFYFHDIAAPTQELNGLDMDERVKEQVAAERKEWEHEKLKDKNKELQKQVEDLEEEVDQLEKELIEAKASRSPLQGFLGEIGSTMVESFIRRNPKMLAKIPGGAELAGLLNDGNETASAMQPESEVTFRRAESGPAALSEEDKASLEFVSQLKARFNQDEFEQVLVVLNGFAHDKGKIQQVLQMMEGNANEQVQV